MAVHNDIFGGVSYLIKPATIRTVAEAQEGRYGLLSLVDRAGGLSTTASTSEKINLFNLSAIEPDVVGEGGKKPLKKPTVTQVSVDVLKLALVLGLTEEQIEDALEDPERFMRVGVLNGFAKKLDAIGTGFSAGSNDTNATRSLRAAVPDDADHRVTLGAETDALRVAISAAMAKLEGRGIAANGVLASTTYAAQVRDARSSVDATVLAYRSFDDVAYGQPVAFSANLPSSGAGKIAAVVGDWSSYSIAIRKALEVRPSAGAVTSDGEVHFAGQYNEVFSVWEMRAGLGVIDPDNFVAIEYA